MKYLLSFIGLMALVTLGVQHMSRSATETRAEVRVEKMMDGWLAGGTGTDGHAQEAICMWFKGVSP